MSHNNMQYAEYPERLFPEDQPTRAEYNDLISADKLLHFLDTELGDGDDYWEIRTVLIDEIQCGSFTPVEPPESPPNELERLKEIADYALGGLIALGGVKNEYADKVAEDLRVLYASEYEDEGGDDDVN